MADAVDARTAKFLLRDALKKLDEEENWEERRKATAQVKAMTELVRRVPRKRKKRRKRRLPRGARIRRCGQGFRSRSSFSGALCSFLLSTGLRCSASWPVCTRRTFPRSSSFMAVAYATLVWLVPMHLTFCSLLASPGPLWTRRTVLSVRSSSFLALACEKLVLLVILHIALFFLSLSSGPRCAASWPVWIRSTVMSVLPGGVVPVVCNNRCFGSRSAENCEFSAVAVHRWSSTSFSCCGGCSPWSSLFSRS